ncbi:MAG: IclR family transcriptional regulator [Spirochaetaceae bacterium]|nr:MAG: IclR family transcriptional regulator [Spirochaetaceae bacterium]
MGLRTIEKGSVRDFVQHSGFKYREIDGHMDGTIDSVEEQSDEPLVPAVERTHRILWELHMASPQGIGASKLAEKLDLPRSSAYRLVRSLKVLGYLSETGVGGRLTLGPSILDIARSAFRSHDLVSVARPYLTRLSSICGQTVKLSAERGNEVEVLDCVESPHPFRLSARIGSRFPITAGAASKVLLAYMPETLQSRVLDEPLPRFTENSITDRNTMAKCLLEIRRDGVATDDEEHAPGIRALAAPVFDSLGRCIAAVSIAYLAASNPASSDLATWEIHLRRCVQEIRDALVGVSS